MRIIAVALDVGAFVTGLLGAWYWRKSAMVPIDQRTVIRVHEDFHATQAETDAMMRAYWASAALNKRAAWWTAAAVLFGAVGNLMGAWPFWG